MTTSKKRIFLVDNHQLVCKSLSDAIHAQEDLTVSGEANSFDEASKALRTETPDALILDLNLGDGSGWRLMEELAFENRLPPTLILSVNDENLYARRLLKSGARGYLMKNAPIGTILTAIRKVLAGHLVFSDSISSMLIARSENIDLPSETEELEQLSNRELQIFEMLAGGMTNKEIAAHLRVSAKTVGTYKARLMAKMGVRTPAQLIKLAAMNIRKN